MSSGVPILPRGIDFISGSIICFGRFFTISVSVIPGATALTLIPNGASSRESETVIPFTANLLAGYITPDG